MVDKGYTTSLIQTKLHKPPLPVGMVKRPRLTKWLEQCRSRPLTLVSAPAGYGKSTLISCWLDSSDCPSAWISLDEHDNELGVFLSYFLAAIQTITPGAAPETQSLLTTTPLPPITTIANTLLNEISQIEEPFILVLDDYQLIEIQDIHDLLNELLTHPSRNLHLVLGTRMDPPLPLITFRANNQLTEIRTQDLRFNQQETIYLFQEMIGAPINQSDFIEIDAQAEGWVTGLRLAALAMRHRIGRGFLHGELSLQNRYVTEYLVSEILAKQAANLSDCMLKTSILDRFCAGLCEHICSERVTPFRDKAGNSENEKSDFGGKQFLDWLEASNLFVIPLDDQHEWFRYHHLFQDFLRQELSRRYSPEQIAEYHAKAGRWYAENGWIEEALHHLLKAGNMEAAIDLIAQQRYKLLNTTQWLLLQRWLNLFPMQVVETSAELWMLKTWLVYHRSQFSELPGLLEKLDTILDKNSSPEEAKRLAGEINSLRSLVAYHAGDAETAIAAARATLDMVTDEFWIVRVLAYLYLSAGLLLSGDENVSYQAIYGAIEGQPSQNKRFKATLLMTACYVHWQTADLQAMEQAARQSITLCQESGHHQILGQANYQLGCVRYQQNDLSEAEALFQAVVSRPYHNYGIAYANSVCGLGMTYQAQGKEMEAREVAEAGIDFLLETGNTTLLPAVLALQAELALRQGRLAAASQWVRKFDPVPPLVPMTWFLAPHLTLVKVWLAQNTPTSLDKAAILLEQLQDYLAGIHNTRFLIETLALRAILEQSRGDQPLALAVLERALQLAQPGEFIRLFVDLGSEMEILLSQLRVDHELKTYVDQIRSAFPDSQVAGAATSQEGLPEPLTYRELQILELLGERLSNKEIAAQLVISPGTVKGHTIQIYQKLDVKGRRQAVEKATALGILAPK